MKCILNPSKAEWPSLVERPVQDRGELDSVVQEVFAGVAANKDSAVRKYTRFYDRQTIEDFRVPAEALDRSLDNIPANLRQALTTAAGNITKFHEVQRLDEARVVTTQGVQCWRRQVAIDSVGLYIPGGTAPLFSTVLMLAIPAKLAGCREIVLCTPPQKDGTVPVEILAAAKLTGINTVFGVGGIQAIAAMALGTESIPKVDKIFGPGNQYVTAAKQWAQTIGTAIDMPAGPSELLVIADNSANPEFVAADLLSQAEHGADSQVVLVTDSSVLLEGVQEALDRRLSGLPRRDMASAALQNSIAVVLERDDWMTFSNAYAPEHLIINTSDAQTLAEQVSCAGSVFIGPFTPESAGDYASGTNHTLPTNGWARNYSGVSLDAFCKTITFQEISKKGLSALAPTIEVMAEYEQLIAHRDAVRVRMEAL